MKKLLLAIGFLFLVPNHAGANDSEAAIAFGGLKLVKNPFISLDKEELYISAQKVQVDYVFTNNSKNDIQTTIAFPLPLIPQSPEDFFQDARIPDYTNLDFKTLIDGQDAQFTIKPIARVKGKDVSKILENHNLKMEWWENADYDLEKFSQTFFKSISDAEMKSLEKQGIVKKYSGYIIPNWQVEINIVRTQLFKAKQSVKVRHTYKPMSGGSVGGALEKPFRKDSLKYYQATYCVDNTFFNAFDGRLTKAIESNQNIIATEQWVSYILKSGANWVGPIKDFRLIVDKGDPTSLVSFCMNGVKKIAPTQFEVRKTNFEPKSDLNILIVNFHKFDE